MEIVDWEDLVGSGIRINRSAAVSIGVFDGVHVGHRRLIRGIIDEAPEMVSVVITFRQNPGRLMRKRAFANILSFEQKLQRLASLGVQHAVLIDFSDEFSKLTGREFLQSVRKHISVKKVVVGRDFRFGHRRGAGPESLRAMLSSSGGEVEVVESVFYNGGVVSSSRIRNGIVDGRFHEVRSMLQASHTLDLTAVGPVDGDSVSRMVRREAIAQVIPKPGVYSVVLSGLGREIAGVAEIDDLGIRLEPIEPIEPIEGVTFVE